MKRLLYWLVFSFCLSTGLIQAQSFVVSGVVLDEEGEPVIGASVFFKETIVGTVTDLDGSFSLTAPSGDAILVVSYLGYTTTEMKVSREKVTIRLKTDVQALKDVVITGIFTRSKESFTGAATVMTAEDLRISSAQNLVSSIANIDPSFYVFKDLAIGSDPNAIPDVTMRGSTALGTGVRDIQNDSRLLDDNRSNSPLILLDGFEIDLQRMIDLDENRIESITLLKDASSTAIYGTRGANGVVVIETKAPESGKLKLTYRGIMSIEAADLSSYNLMNSMEKLEFEQKAGLYIGKTANQQYSLSELYNQRLKEALRGVDTYWIKYPVRNAIGQKHNVRIEGGEGGFLFAAALNYNNIEGTMKDSNRNTLNGSMFFSYRKNNFFISNDLQVAYNKSKKSPYGKFEDWTKINSYYKPYDENGNLVKVLENAQYSNLSGSNSSNKVYNPLWNANQPGKNEEQYTEVTNNLNINWYITPELSVRGRLGITKKNNQGDVYYSANNTMFDEYTEDNFDRRGKYTMTFSNRFLWETNLTVNYNKRFAEKHHLQAGFNYGLSEEKKDAFEFVAEGISTPTMDFISMASQYEKDKSPKGEDYISRRLGGTANVNYTYDRRYFVDLVGTIEASSKFGSKNRTAPFFSTGLGWNMHEESFLRENAVLNTARLRLSYGTVGSQKFDPWQALRTYKTYTTVNYKGWGGSYLMGLGNDELGWQITKQLNFGTDVDLFDRRVMINFDVYNKLTEDLLSDVTLPAAGGFTSYKSNVGEVQNRGFEVTLNTAIIRNPSKKIYLNAGATLVHNKNKIKKISDALKALNDELKNDEENERNPSFLYEEGESINTFYVVPSLGIDPANGKEIYVKKDGTLTYDWDANDKVACGTEDPKFRGTFNTRLRVNNFTFNAIFSYYWGGQRENRTLASKVENIRPYDNADKRALYDRWSKPGDNVFFKRISDYSTTRATSRFIMNDNSLTCSSLMLSYDFEKKLLENIGVDYLTLSLYTEDLFTVSSIKVERGTTYPYARKFYLSLTAKF